MAKPNKKEVTPMKLKPARIIDETDEPNIVEEAAEEVVESEEETPEVVEEAPVKKEAAPQVKAQTDSVNFNFLVDIDPSPVVGRFRFVDELGVTTIKAGQVFAVPRHVAMHLKDKKVGVIVA